MERALKAEQVLRIAAEQAHDAQKDANRTLRHELYEVKTALEDEKGKTKKLLAQLNRDYENSSIPSSRSVHHKKISNNRERSGRKPGAQPGHVHHGRKSRPRRKSYCYLRQTVSYTILISGKPKRRL